MKCYNRRKMGFCDFNMIKITPSPIIIQSLRENIVNTASPGQKPQNVSNSPVYQIAPAYPTPHLDRHHLVVNS